MTTHAISATYTRFDRMSPTAAALAVLLHVATALALWWVSPLNRISEPKEEAIEVTIEPPKPPTAPPSLPQANPAPTPAPPIKLAPPTPPKGVQSPPLGLPPPSPTTGETNKQSATKEETRQPEPQQQQPKADPKPAPQPQPEQQQQQQALAPKGPAPAPAPPPPRLEQSLPPLEAPPPPLTSKDFPKPPPPPPPPPSHPQARTAPPPPSQQLRPSPLTTPQQPKRAPSAPQGNAPSATFVNPADTYNQAQIVEQYLWRVAARISQYRYYSNRPNEQGTVVVRLVIARDGRLLDASIARSSGIINLDTGLLEAVRAAAPYAPFPEGIPGTQQAFILPLSSIYRQ